MSGEGLPNSTAGRAVTPKRSIRRDGCLPADQLRRLAAAIGYPFKDPLLLSAALTHRSFGQDHNERLEFLGDALLGFVIAEALYRQFPSMDEGVLTRLRATLVKRETLAELALAMDLGPFLRLGEGERKSGGWHRTSTLANAFEAVVGALYLDAGMEASQAWLLKVFAERLQNLSPETVQKDPKTQLQEYLQAKHLPLPDYRVIAVHGEPHNQHFIVSCAVSGLSDPVQADGSSKQRAEQAAAVKALALLYPSAGI